MLLGSRHPEGSPIKSASLEGRRPERFGRILRGSLRSHLRMTEWLSSLRN